MAVNIPGPLVELLNKTEPGFFCLMHAVPTRIFRITVNTQFLTFRVEQLNRSNRDDFNPKGSWVTLSTHGSEVPGGMYDAAFQALKKAQRSFQQKMAKKLAARFGGKPNARIIRP